MFKTAARFLDERPRDPSSLVALAMALALSTSACASSSTKTSADSGAADGPALDAQAADVAGGDAEIDAARTYTLGGTVTGLSGTGLILANGTEMLAIAATGPFHFEGPVADGAPYAVTIATQPTSTPSQTCTLSNATGTVASSNVTSVTVTCATSKFQVGGTVSGLTGTGLVLANNGDADDLVVTASGTFSFPKPVASGGPYAVTVRTQPSAPNQRCTITGGAGTVGSADVASVSISCVVFECEDTSSITVDRTRSIDMSGSSLFFTTGEGYSDFKVYDLSTPAAPTPQGSLTLTQSTGCWYPGGAALAPGGNYAYLYGLGCTGLPVIDVTDRTHPVALSVVGGTSGGSMDLEICGNVAYLAVQSKGVAAYDVSNPAAPAFLAESDVAGMPYPIGVTCAVGDATTDYVYLGDGGTNAAPAGLRIYEFNKSTHAFAARGAHVPTVHTWGGRGWPLTSSLLYMEWSDTGQLALFDISNKDTIPAPTTFPNAGDPNTQLLVTGNHLFTTYGGGVFGLGVYDISRPASPSLLYNKPFNATVAGMSRFTNAGQDYLVYTVNGGTSISVCHLINL